MKIFTLIKGQLLVLLVLIAVCNYSCKKSAVAPVQKQVVLTNDSITQGNYTLLFINKDTTYQQKGDSSRKALEKIFFMVYPEITAYWNPDAPHKVTIVVDPATTGVAYTLTSTATFYLNPSWVLQNLKDVNVVTHESTHVAQQYLSSSYTPSWLVEGLADYSRNKFGIDNAAVGWYIPDYSQDEKYTDGYTTVARFLLWAEAKYRPGIAQALDKELRAGTYSDDTSWQALTGSTFNELWNAYVVDPYY